MQAIVFDDFGGPEVLVARETARPQVRPHDLLVRNASIGVNRADLSHRKGAYGRAFFGDSDIMGLEIAGTVVDVGPEVEGFSVGDRVMGIVGGGAYAEFSRIDYRMAMPVPESLSLIDAGAVAEVFVTAHEALFHLARLQAGESVLIHAAAGGVGSAAVQLARAAGARVFATTGADKRDAVRGFGADEVIDYRTEDFQSVVTEKTEGKGVDVVIDFIGGAYLERNVRSLAVGGRMVVVGLLGGTASATLPMDTVLYRHLQIFGTVMKSRPAEVKQAMTRRFAERWLDALANGTLRPVIDSTYPLAEAAQAHRRMETGESVGKVVLLPEAEAAERAGGEQRTGEHEVEGLGMAFDAHGFLLRDGVADG